MTQPLKGPLEQHLSPALDDAQLQRVAQQLKAARRAPASSGAVWRLALAAALLVAIAGAVIRLTRPAPGPRPLTTLDGDEMPSAFEGQSWVFADQSRLTVSGGGRTELVANEPSQVTFLVRKGTTRFEVTPGGPRKWIVEAGLVRVEVVGTVFSVARDATGVGVTVEHGTVIVRGDAMPDGLMRLDAGMKVFAPANEPPLPRRGEGRGEGPTAAPGESAPKLAAEPARKPPSAEQLLQQSDDARAASNDGQAAELLAKLLALWPSDPSAPSAAFTLGRLELEKLNRPADAAKHFALAAQSPALSADARLRQVEALAAAGDVPAAEAAARDAIARAPSSPQAGRLERWLQDPQHAPSWLH